MGRGDKRSKKGKIWRSSYGNSRPKNSAYKPGDEKSATKAAPAQEAPTPVVEPTPPTE